MDALGSQPNISSDDESDSDGLDIWREGNQKNGLGNEWVWKLTVVDQGVD
jgi:hypothetical protein